MATQPIAREDRSWSQSDMQDDAIRTGTVALHAAYWLAHPHEMQFRFTRGRALPPPIMPDQSRGDRTEGVIQSPATSDIPTIAHELIEAVASFFGFTTAEITGADRRITYIDARSVVAQILRLRGWSAGQIGRQLNRDHSTILNLLDKFEIYQRRSEFARQCYEQLKHMALPIAKRAG